MKHVAISALAVAAFGATVVGTQTAEAAGWVGSAWNPIGTFSHLTTSEGFTAEFVVGSPSGVTVSANTTGFVNVPGVSNPFCIGTECPTAHQAFSLCRDGSYLSGPIILAGTVGGAQNESLTSTTTGSGAGYWIAGSPGSPPTQLTDTGFCPSSAPMIQGGVNVYNY
jgi:hypothetical protein